MMRNAMRLPAIALAAVGAALSICARLPAAEGKRPNVLIVVVDDQSPLDFRAYNPGSSLETPAFDRLAAEGMLLDGAYHQGAWSGAVCTPSRTMIMTGRTVWHIPDLRSPQRPDRAQSPHGGDPTRVPPGLPQQTLAAVFNRAGYDTMRTCKVGNSYVRANEQFTVRHEQSCRGASDEQGSAWHAERVLDYLDQRQASDDPDPFLIYLGFSHPHDPRNGQPELLQKYGASNHRDPSVPPVLASESAAPALPINYLPAHPFPHGHPKLRDEEQVEGVWKRRDPATVRNELGREFACAENIDIQLGRVLDRLGALGELENTYVLFTSDHGIAIGRHGLMGKQNLYEHTWRVPMVVRGPGIAAGSRAGGNVYLLDILATVCDLAGIEAPKTCEGLSFRPVLEGKQARVRDTLYGVYSGGTKPGMRAVRRGDWKLIKYDTLDGTVRETQLFNLAENPAELLAEHQDPRVVATVDNQPAEHQRNLADDSRYAAKLAEMEALLLEQMVEHDDPYRLWDQPEG